MKAVAAKIATRFSALIKSFANSSGTPKTVSEADVADRLDQERESLMRRLEQSCPRILIVKQDVNEDLYCCPVGTSPDQIVLSTLLRTGPVALFSELKADFRIVRTEDTPGCGIWKERATSLRWDSLEFFSSYQREVPGRNYGQSSLAVSSYEIDWSQYDIVISIDISVPENVVAANPRILWAYYIREIKAPAYQLSLKNALAGYDRVLNHGFRLNRPSLANHVLEFPYHLQYYGCFHKLFSLTLPESRNRDGVFVDHHTMVKLSPEDRTKLRAFGWLASTVHEGDREIIPTSERLPRRTMDSDLKEHFLNSRYFLITPGQRSVFGTALVEAIAAGCLAIGSPEAFREHGYLFNDATSASTVSEAIERIRQFELDHEAYAREVTRQRTLIDYVCYVRPLGDLLNAWDLKRSQIVNPKKAE